MTQKHKHYHKITENSAFFQGHKEQLFSREGMSFQIISNYYDLNKEAELNIAKYKPLFTNLINKYISARLRDGGHFNLVNTNDLQIRTIKLIDDVEEEDICGKYQIFPRGALCKRDNCNHYFILDKGRHCGHSNNDPWEQITFVAFCDDCGRMLPLHYMTNILKDCRNCGTKNGLSKLSWLYQDDLSTYKVQCINCGYETSLFFLECDHEIRKNNQKLSDLQKRRFRGIPARAGSIIHPYVITIPDLPQEGEIDPSGRRNQQGKLLSEAFYELISLELQESLLYLPEFRDIIINTNDFWKLNKIKDTADDLNLEISNRKQWEHSAFMRLIRTILKRAKSALSEGGNRVQLIERYGINYIKNAINNIKNIEFTENDLQGLFLLSSITYNQETKIGPKKRNLPISHPPNFVQLLKKYGLAGITHIENLNMIQAIIGIVEGSTRRSPLLFRTIMMGKENNIPTVYVRTFSTEGLIFQLEYKQLLKWLKENNEVIDPNVEIEINGSNPEVVYRKLIINNKKYEKAVTTLLHTYSHMLIQQSTIYTGLDISSLSEIIYPKSASIFLYSTNPVNIGGLGHTFDYYLSDWLRSIEELALNCPQDPACMFDENGSCNACCYVPEFVCFNFNQELDRSSLIGSSSRFVKGYLHGKQNG